MACQHVIRQCCIAVGAFTLVAVVLFMAHFQVMLSEDHGDLSFLQRLFKPEIDMISGTASSRKCDADCKVYISLLIFVSLVNLTIVIPAVVVVLRRRCDSMIHKLERARSLEAKPGIEVIIPCYLPNEQHIITHTIQYILDKLEAPGDLSLWVVYNTCEDLPEAEARLRAMESMSNCGALPHGRKLRVLRAETSQSKAENLNEVIPMLSAKYTAIYDADHLPDPESLMLLYEKAERLGLACAQGSTYIRNLNDGWMGRFIDAEFFVTHFVYFPCMKMMTQNAVFGGSNSLWLTKVLSNTTFDKTLQTEDIDLSIRMSLKSHRIDFCPEARSGELAPISFRALLRQRLRWAIGWDQVSLIHFWDVVAGKGTSFARRAGLAYVLYARWVVQISGIIAGIAIPLFSLMRRVDPTLFQYGLAADLLTTSLFYFFAMLMFLCVTEALCQSRHRGIQSLLQVIFVALFMVLSCFYVSFQSLMIVTSLFQIFTGTVGGWVVTQRARVQDQVERQKTSRSLTGSTATPQSLKSADSPMTSSSKDALVDNLEVPEFEVHRVESRTKPFTVQAHIKPGPVLLGRTFQRRRVAAFYEQKPTQACMTPVALEKGVFDVMRFGTS